METKRLILRRYKEEDLDDLYEYLSDPEVVRYEPYLPHTMEQTKESLAWRISTDQMIAVELKDTHKMIGNIYVSKEDFDAMEIGYVFNQKYWHQGYAKEAAQAVIAEAFHQGIHRIFACCDQQNPNSFKLLESLGFVREGDFKQKVYFWKDEDGNPLWKDSYEYSLLNPSVVK